MKAKKISKKAVVILTVICAVVVTAGYFGVTNAAKKNVPQTLQREYPVSRGDITAGVEGAGAVVYNGTPQNFELPVTIGELFVAAGQTVKAGDKIAAADEKALNDTYEAAEAELEKARAALSQARNAKELSSLNAQKEAETGRQGEAEMDSQLAQAQSVADGFFEQVKRLEAQIVEIDASLASLPEGDPQAAELKQQQDALKQELDGARTELDSANAALSDLGKAKDAQEEAREKSNAIDKKIANANASDLDNAARLAQIDVETAQKRVDQLKAVMDDPFLYATNDGVVISLGYGAGAETKTDTPIATIGDPDQKTLVIPVSQSDIGKIEEGQKVEFSLEAYQDQTFSGTVKSRSLVPVENSNPLSYGVTVEPDPSDSEMLDGMTVNATFIIKQKKDVLTLSNKAITVKDAKQYVRMRGADGTLRDVEITTGFSDGRVSEITSGLADGDVVIVEG